MAMVTDSNDPITTTNRIAFSVSPNHNTAKGSQQMLGKLCRLTSNPPMISSRNLLLATPRPRTIPSTTDNEYPSSMRFMLTAIAIQNEWSEKPAHSDSKTPLGVGKTYGGHTFNSASSTHVAIRTP